MSRELEQINELEREIAILVDMEAKLDRYARREPPGEHRQLVENQRRDVTRRANIAQAELREVVAIRQLAIARERQRAAVTAFAERRPVRFFEIEEIAA